MLLNTATINSRGPTTISTKQIPTPKLRHQLPRTSAALRAIGARPRSPSMTTACTTKYQLTNDVDREARPRRGRRRPPPTTRRRRAARSGRPRTRSRAPRRSRSARRGRSSSTHRARIDVDQRNGDEQGRRRVDVGVAQRDRGRGELAPSSPSPSAVTPVTTIATIGSVTREHAAASCPDTARTSARAGRRRRAWLMQPLRHPAPNVSGRAVAATAAPRDAPTAASRTAESGSAASRLGSWPPTRHADPGIAALGTWSGGRFMHFGEPLDEDRLVALLTPDATIHTVVTADVYGSGDADRLLGRALAASRREEVCVIGAVGHDFYTGERAGAKGFPRFTDPALRGARRLRALPADGDRAQPRALRHRPLRRAAAAQPGPHRLRQRGGVGRAWRRCATPA